MTKLFTLNESCTYKKRGKIKYPFILTVFIGLMLLLAQCNKEQAGTVELPDYIPEEKPVYDSVYVIEEKNVYLKTVDEETGEEKEQKYLCTKRKHSLSENPEDFVTSNPLTDVLKPGLIVKGSSVFNGIPVEIPIADKRKNITVSLEIVSGGNGVFYKEIKPEKSKINAAMNEILNSYDGGSPASYYYTSELITSQQHLEAALRMKYSSPIHNLSANANFTFDNNKTTLLVSLTQSFFTFSIDALSEANAFTDGNVPAEIANYIKPETDGTPNPLAFISSVTYGRVYKLLYTSTDKSFDLSAAINYAYKGSINNFNADVDAAYKKKFSSVSVKVWQLGGNAQDGLATAFINDPKDFSKIKDFIVGGAIFSKDNVGAPISYKVRTIKDNKLLSINNTLNYVSEEYTPIKEVSPNDSTIVKDIDGNIYPIVKIGKQTWMAHNLYTSHLNDGTDIKKIAIASNFDDEKVPACYGYVSSNHGYLYNYYAIENGNLCPVGWHVPSYADWNTLKNTLGTNSGQKLKTKDSWGSFNGTNDYGFNAEPCGTVTKGVERDQTVYCIWWTTTLNGDYLNAFYVSNFNQDLLSYNKYPKNYGLSVRCIKD